MKLSGTMNTLIRGYMRAKHIHDYVKGVLTKEQ